MARVNVQPTVKSLLNHFAKSGTAKNLKDAEYSDEISVTNGN